MIKQLKNQYIPLIKVFCRNYNVEEATWEIEQNVRMRHHEAFLVNLVLYFQLIPLETFESGGKGFCTRK